MERWSTRLKYLEFKRENKLRTSDVNCTATSEQEHFEESNTKR